MSNLLVECGSQVVVAVANWMTGLGSKPAPVNLINLLQLLFINMQSVTLRVIDKSCTF